MKELLASLEKNQQKKLIGSVTVLLIIVIAIALGVGYFVGQNIMYNSKLSDAVVEKAASLDTECSEKQAKLDELQEQLRNEQKLVNEVNTYKSRYQKLNDDLQKLQTSVAQTESNLASLENQIAEKQTELDRLKGDILKAAGEPKTLISGDYIVRQDLPAGRYVVSGSSNFYVYTADGQLYINTILGNNKYADGDYTATLNDGMIMHCSSKTKFTPVTNK